jgi:hypothetical protein
MTYEHRIVLSFDEVRALVLECNQCKSRISIPPEKLEYIPETCPYGHSWQAVGLGQSGTFLKSLKYLKGPVFEKTGFSIFLEFEEPKQ